MIEENFARRGMGVTLWFTGLSAAGKTTLCREFQARLIVEGMSVEVLDGDLVRRELCAGLGFSRRDRDENVRRLAFVANLLTQNGVIVLVAAISPYRQARDEARRQIQSFLEIYVNAPLEVCERRDPKGLYGRARAGLMSSFTGISDPYEPPLNPDVECRTDLEDIAMSVEKIMAAFRSHRLSIRRAE